MYFIISVSSFKFQVSGFRFEVEGFGKRWDTGYKLENISPVRAPT
jgi:hypothetical protein